MKNRKFTFHFLAFCTAAVWGTTFISSKILIVEHSLSPAMVFFLRFLIAYIGLWLFCLLPRRHEKLLGKSLKDEIIFLFLGVTGGSIYFLSENSALEYTNASNVSFLVSIAPLTTYLMTAVTGKLRVKGISSGQEHIGLSSRFILGSALAVLGVGAVIFNGRAMHISPKGDFLALAAALLWSVYSVLLGPVGDRYSSVFITRKVFFYGLLTILPFVLSEGFPDFAVLKEPVVIGNLLFLGIVASLLGFLVWNMAVSEIGNVSATNYIYFCPFFTLLLSSAVLDERMTVMSSLGSVAIVIGVFLAGRKNIK